ncbi:MAG: FAD-dependent oxidoreductase [Acidobacteriota bacterium]
MQYIIVGNGIAGTSAARAIREIDSGGPITMISGETAYPFSRTALMYLAMGQMRLEDTEFLERRSYRQNRIHLLHDRAERLDTVNRRVVLSGGDELQYDRLLLATGSLPARLGSKGTELDGVVHFVSYLDMERLMRLVERARRRSRRAVVVGGGLIGIEVAEVLVHHGLTVDYLIREDSYWSPVLSAAEGHYVESHMATFGVRVHLQRELAEIVGSGGCVREIVTNHQERIPCDLVAIAVGVIPNTALAKASGIPTGRGILADWQLSTRAPDVYAAGDCVEIVTPGAPRNFIRAIWYSARDMGRVAGRNMAGRADTFDPGQWYNSAKFFHLEYTAAGKTSVDGEEDGEYLHQDGRHSIRIVHRDGRLLGFSMIGSRWDHSVLLRFIRERRDLDYFFAHAGEARFDSEMQGRLSLGREKAL